MGLISRFFLYFLDVYTASKFSFSDQPTPCPVDNFFDYITLSRNIFRVYLTVRAFRRFWRRLVASEIASFQGFIFENIFGNMFANNYLPVVWTAHESDRNRRNIKSVSSQRDVNVVYCFFRSTFFCRFSRCTFKIPNDAQRLCEIPGSIKLSRFQRLTTRSGIFFFWYVFAVYFFKFKKTTIRVLELDPTL